MVRLLLLLLWARVPVKLLQLLLIPLLVVVERRHCAPSSSPSC
jgi:hypothetical protein